MRFVDRPHLRPMRCAALPHIGQTYPTRWIDTGSELVGVDNHVYLSEIAVREAAGMLGMVPGVQVRDRDRVIAELQQELQAARDALDEVRAKLDAIDLIESEGFRARKKPGRKPREEVSA